MTEQQPDPEFDDSEVYEDAPDNVVRDFDGVQDEED